MIEIPQNVKKKCQRGTFESAIKMGRAWCLNKNEKPKDARITTGEYKNWRNKKESDSDTE